MTTSVSGGSGSGISGLRSDGAGGIRVQHGFTGGDSTATIQDDYFQYYGTSTFQDTVGTNEQDEEVFQILQVAPTTADGWGAHAFSVVRNGNISAHDYQSPTAQINDATASLRPVFIVTKQGEAVLELNGIKSITGALSSITDAAAKAVLTSIIATLADIKVATNDTT